MGCLTVALLLLAGPLEAASSPDLGALATSETETLDAARSLALATAQDPIALPQEPVDDTVLALPARPQGFHGPRQLQLKGGVGFTLDPDLVLWTLGLDHSPAASLALGPALQLGYSHNETFVAPTLQVSYRKAGVNPDVVGHVVGGVGFGYLEKERRGRDRSDVRLLFTVGAGADYRIDRRVSLGTQILFDLFPVDAVNEHVIFTWQLIGVRYDF